jgi:hypothetical protein
MAPLLLESESSSSATLAPLKSRRPQQGAAPAAQYLRSQSSQAGCKATLQIRRYGRLPVHGGGPLMFAQNLITWAPGGNYERLPCR